MPQGTRLDLSRQIYSVVQFFSLRTLVRFVSASVVFAVGTRVSVFYSMVFFAGNVQELTMLLYPQ